MKQNFPKRSEKEIPQVLGFNLDRLAHCGIIFAPVRKSLRNEKKTSACLKKNLEIMHKLRPYIQKNEGFLDPISKEKRVATALYYLAD